MKFVHFLSLIIYLKKYLMTPILGTAMFFGHVDPRDLDLITTPKADFSILGGYAIGFFFFWLMCGIASLLSVFLIRTSRRQDGRARGQHH